MTGASFINYYRTPEEFRAPFDDESSAGAPPPNSGSSLGVASPLPVL